VAEPSVLRLAPEVGLGAQCTNDLFVTIPPPFSAVVLEFGVISIVQAWAIIVLLVLRRSLAALGRNFLRTGAAALVLSWARSVFLVHKLFPREFIELLVQERFSPLPPRPWQTA
jgi:hypothetical protein